MRPSRRDHLVDTAADLFYREGFHATGIDRVLAEAGVAKMTLYKHFGSKEALIQAALKRRGESFREYFRQAVARRSSDPRERLLAIFEVLGEVAVQPGFQGCFFIKALGEFGDSESPARQAAIEHKALLHAEIARLAEAAGAAEPEALARQLALLVEGVLVLAPLDSRSELAARAPADARAAAEVLLAAALPA